MEQIDGYLRDLELLEEAGALYFTMYYGIGSEFGIDFISQKKTLWAQGDLIEKIQNAYNNKGQLIYQEQRFRVKYTPADNQAHRIVGLI